MKRKAEMETDDDLGRCQRVRSELWAQFTSLDEMFEFLKQEDKKHARRGGSAKAFRSRSTKTMRSTERNKRTTKG